MNPTIDHLGLLPAYLAAATAVCALITELVVARRAPVLVVTAAGMVATGIAAALVPPGRESFCVSGTCSIVTSRPGAFIAVVLCAASLVVLALSTPALTRGEAPTGEYVFLLACSLTGGVVLAYARDLISIIVALETLTLPLYALVALRRAERRSTEQAVNFLLVSVSASAITLFGAALLYAVTGRVGLKELSEVLSDGDPLALTAVAMGLVVAGLAFKVAAVPLHGWAPGTYDAAPLPIAAYLSTVSKLGGVLALVWVLVIGFAPVAPIAGTVLAVLSIATMTLGNLAALRQTRAVRLLAWSSIAQAGYLLAPLGALADSGEVTEAGTTALSFAVLYVIMELTAFASLIALRGNATDGGALAEYAGMARRGHPPALVLVLALTALAGLPPGLVGLFAKITVFSGVAAAAPWLAVIVGLNAVIGLVYYLRFAALLLRGPSTDAPATRTPVLLAYGAAAAMTVLTGFAPQLVLGLTQITP